MMAFNVVVGMAVVAEQIASPRAHVEPPPPGIREHLRQGKFVSCAGSRSAAAPIACGTSNPDRRTARTGFPSNHSLVAQMLKAHNCCNQ